MDSELKNKLPNIENIEGTPKATFFNRLTQNKKVIVILASLFLLIVGILIFNHFSKPAATTSLTPEIIARLQSYPFEKDPLLDFNEIIKQKPALAKWIKDTLFSKIIRFEDNEKFFTSEKLTYLTWNHHYAIRGVLQVTHEDGTITEQDVEYEYKYGGWSKEGKFYFEGERLLSKEKIVRR